MQPDSLAPPPGYVRVPVPQQTPPVAGEPVNGAIGVRPAPRPTQLGPLTRWLFEQGLDEPDPLRYSADGAYRIVTMTFAEVVHVISWGRRFDAHQPHRLPADRYLGQAIVQTEIARHGWTIVFRCVETAAGQ